VPSRQEEGSFFARCGTKPGDRRDRPQSRDIQHNTIADELFASLRSSASGGRALERSCSPSPCAPAPAACAGAARWEGPPHVLPDGAIGAFYPSPGSRSPAGSQPASAPGTPRSVSRLLLQAVQHAASRGGGAPTPPQLPQQQQQQLPPPQPGSPTAGARTRGAGDGGGGGGSPEVRETSKMVVDRLQASGGCMVTGQREARRERRQWSSRSLSRALLQPHPPATRQGLPAKTAL
jgi:hypothetical protein